jgi:hypothetical protein
MPQAAVGMETCREPPIFRKSRQFRSSAGSRRAVKRGAQVWKMATRSTKFTRDERDTAPAGRAFWIRWLSIEGSWAGSGRQSPSGPRDRETFVHFVTLVAKIPARMGRETVCLGNLLPGLIALRAVGRPRRASRIFVHLLLNKTPGHPTWPHV